MVKQISRWIALSGLALATAGAAVAQQSTDGNAPGVYHPRTHTFAARPHRMVVPEVTAAKTYAGTFKFVFTVKLVTPVASGQDLICFAAAGVDDYSTSTDAEYNYYDETASAVAKVTGSTATCTVEIPYSWSLEYESTDEVGFDYNLDILPTSTSSPYYYDGVRTHESLLPSSKVPTSGATTTIAVSATL